MNGAELERCMRLFYRSVYRTALCRCKDPHDADDAAQEVFLKLYTCNNEFSDDEHIKAWLLRCTINLSTDLLRARKRAAALSVSAAEPSGSVPDDENGHIFELLRKLPEKNRTAMYMHYCEGYSVEEVAKITGAGKNAVLSRLMRGRKQLKKLLENEGGGRYGN